MTVAEWARGLGITRQAGHLAVKRCNIPLEGGKVDPAVATVLYQQRTRARAKAHEPTAAPAPAAAATPASAPAVAGEGVSPTAEADTYQSLRIRRERVELEEAEIRAARAAGRALDRERAERGVHEAFRELRDAVFAAGKSAARRTVGLTEVREVELTIEDELRAAFSGWEERMRQRLEEAART